MEEYLTGPLPTLSDAREEGLPIDYDQKTLESALAQGGTLTSPANGDDTATIIHWQAAHLLSKIDPDVLKGLLSKLPGASSKIGEIPMIKSYMNLLLLLTEEDSEKQWITRIPYGQEDRRFLVDQVEPLLRVMKRFTGFRVPKLYHYGLMRDENNKLLIDYMLLDFIDGRQMPMWTETYPAWEQEEQILDQLADIYLEIFSKPASYEDRVKLPNANFVDGVPEDFDAFDLPPTMTTSLYLHQKADEAICRKFQRLLASDATEVATTRHATMVGRLVDLLTLFLMRAIISAQVIGEYNDAPFYITHPDLHNRNIIIDSEPARDRRSRFGRGPGFYKSSLLLSSTLSSRRRAMSAPNDRARIEPIKIAGIIDWDAAHPIPLQCAAIYPKFLETLPGAEFPDLPSEYEAPDLGPEKDLFLDILRRKELAATGDQLVTNLICYGSWERDFFNIALSRGDVRKKWLEHWRGQEANKAHMIPRSDYEFSLGDIKNMWDGMRGFLSQEKNRCEVTRHRGWDLVTRIALQLEENEHTAVDSLCIKSAQYREQEKARHLDGNM